MLAQEVERRMAERLQFIRQAPERILDAGCGPGSGLAQMRQLYPKAQLIGLDSAPNMVRQARGTMSLAARASNYITGRVRNHVCADLAHIPLATASVGMIWSNLVLAWAADPQAVLSEAWRVLQPEGLLMFSTYGPDTLKEMRAAFSGLDDRVHVHRFADMHDLGDMLVANGFADPVVDMEIITLEYDGVDAIARDLRLSGQSNVDTDRRRALMTPRMWARMSQAYESRRRNGRLPATFEIVYGHAWRGVPRPRGDGTHVVTISPARKKAN